jgi:hypothetical protein
MLTPFGSWPTIYMSCKTAFKRGSLSLALMVALAGRVCPQADSATPFRVDADLTLKVLGKHYCSNSKTVRSLFLKVKLELVNNGAPFEIYVPFSGVRIVSRSLAAVAVRKHEVEMHAPQLPIPELRQRATPEERPRLVPSGGRVESIDDAVQLFVQTGSSASDLMALKPGKHYLQLQIDVFPPGTKMADAISVVKRVVSEPVPFIVEEKPVAPACSDLFKSNH